MTNKERFLAAIKGNQTDKPSVVIPYMGIFVRDHWEQITGFPWHKMLFGNAVSNLEDAQIVYSQFNVDLLAAGLGARRDYIESHKVIEENGKHYIVDINTGKKEELQKPIGATETHERTIKAKKDVDEQIKVISAEELIQTGRTDFLKNRVDMFGEKYFITAGVSAPFCAGHHYFSVSDLLIALYEEKELLHYFMRKVNDRSIENIRVYAKSGCQGVFIEETFTSKDLISYEHFKEIFPYTKELIAEVKKCGMKAIHYFCGDISDERLEDLITSGADLLGFEESKKTFSIDIENIAKLSAGRVALLGNIDSYGILEKASDEKLKKEIERQYESGMKYNKGKFIISLGSPVTPNTPIEKVKKYIDLARNIKSIAATIKQKTKIKVKGGKKMKNYGHFSEDSLEYVVTDPVPPRDWMNIIWNKYYVGWVAQNLWGSGLYQTDKGLITNLFGKQDVLVPGRLIYVRDNNSKNFWTVNWDPVQAPYTKHICRHGMGYSIIENTTEGISSEFRVFAPVTDDPVELWTYKIKNTTDQEKNVSLFFANSLTVDGNTPYFGYIASLDAMYIKKIKGVFAKNYVFAIQKEKYRGFMCHDFTIDGFDCSEMEFLGKYRSFAKPAVVVEGKCHNTNAVAENLIGVLQKNIKLKPGEEKVFNLALGVVYTPEEAAKLAGKYLKEGVIDKQFELLKKKFSKRIGGLEISTPDKELDRFINTWLKHQLYFNDLWARIYFKGFRDTLQDSLGIGIFDWKFQKEKVLEALKYQSSNGFCPRAFKVPNSDLAEGGKWYADSPAWMAFSTTALLKETGDLNILKLKIPYKDKGTGTVYEHNIKALRFLYKDLGPHGLVRIHDGDWNDLINMAGVKGKGESVFLSCITCYSLLEMEELCKKIGKTKDAGEMRKAYEKIKKNILKNGWDGQWFKYGYTDSGKPFGTHKAKEGKIFLNPQSWAVISKVVEGKDARNLMKTTHKMLDSKCGPLHNKPQFTLYDPEIGQLTCSSPGFFTNGNNYSHASAFNAFADLLLGDGNTAYYKNMKRVLPHDNKLEPYAVCSMYIGPDAIHRAEETIREGAWRTGTASWTMVNVVEGLLGIKRDYDGLRIQPSLPSGWKNCRIVRPFRANIYEIEIKRSGNGNKVVQVVLDGKNLSGNLVPYKKDGKKHKVTVKLQ